LRSRSVYFLSLVVSVGFTVPLPSSAAVSGSQTNPPVYKAQAREVVVDVVVTKGMGEPVTGLHAKDFVVMEDGKPQTIDFFEAHSPGKLPDNLKPLPMPPGVYTNVPPAPEGDAVNVLLLDSLNTDQQDQSYVHRQIISFLKSIPPGTKIAIFMLSSHLRMVQGFTTDTAILQAALNDPKYGFTPTKPSASRSLSDKVDDLEDVRRMVELQMSLVGLEGLKESQASHASYQLDQRVAMTLEALSDISRFLAAVPGRKNLIWFASSFPITVFPNAREKHGESELHDYNTAVKQAADLLTVSKVAVYPVGAEGMMVPHICDPVINSMGCYDLEGGNVSGGSGPVPSGRPSDFTTPFTNENAARSDKIMAMEQLAADTGGKAFYNTNDLNAAMQHAIADGSNYYTVVYSPTNKKMDGSYRHIEIKLAEGKYKLAYRRGYNADDSLVLVTKPDADPLSSLMTPGLPASTQIIYAVKAVPANPQPAANAAHAGKNAKLTGPTERYGVDFLIRTSDVRLETASDGHHAGKLHIELRAYDRAGHAVNWVGGTNILDLSPDLYAAAMQSGIRAHIDIDLPLSSEVLLETGVYDAETGRAGSLEVPLHVTATAAGTTAQD
jgi:VWFA-related protein